MSPTSIYLRSNIFPICSLIALVAALIILWPTFYFDNWYGWKYLIVLALAFNIHGLWRSHEEIKSVFAHLAKAPSEAPAPEERDYYYGLHTNIRSSAGSVDLYDGNILMQSIRRADVHPLKDFIEIMQFELPYRGMFWRSFSTEQYHYIALRQRDKSTLLYSNRSSRGGGLEIQDIDLVLFEALGNRLAGLLGVPKKQYIEEVVNRR